MRTYSRACDRLDLEVYPRVSSDGQSDGATSFPLSDSERKNISQRSLWFDFNDAHNVRVIDPSKDEIGDIPAQSRRQRHDPPVLCCH